MDTVDRALSPILPDSLSYVKVVEEDYGIIMATMNSPRQRENWSLFAHARKASKALGSPPNLIWATAYLVCILVFACVYTWFPKDAWFYSKITHERRHKDYAEAFEQIAARWLESDSGPSV